MDSAAPNPKRPLENTRSVLDLVEEQAGLRPGAEAVRAGSLALSYEALASRGHRIAAHLHAMGIGPEVAVGLCVKSSPAMVAGALGIFEAGAASSRPRWRSSCASRARASTPRASHRTTWRWEGSR